MARRHAESLSAGGARGPDGSGQWITIVVDRPARAASVLPCARVKSPLDASLDRLVAAARAVAENAYAPASRFPVGAALLADDGAIFVGCNVENASYGLTICAERNAVFAAVAAGHRRFTAVVIHTECDPPGYPCGACLQVLAEFGPQMEVVLVNAAGKMVRTSLPSLMPRPFRFESLPELSP